MENLDEIIQTITDEILSDKEVSSAIKKITADRIENDLSCQIQDIREVIIMLLGLTKEEKCKVEGVITGIHLAKRMPA